MTEESGVWKGRLYVTFEREYVVHGEVCVRVRDRASGTWCRVLPNRVLGAVPREETDPEFVGEPGLGPPRVGERLCIQVGGQRVVTSPILAIEPARMIHRATPGARGELASGGARGGDH